MTPPAAPAGEPGRLAGQHRTRAGPPGLYRPLAGLVVRAPLLPAADYRRLGADGNGFARAWADPAIRFAVEVASPDLAAALPQPGGSGAPSVRARAALQRYLIRASLRPTPFGAFAATAIGHWADRTSLRISPARWPTRTRPDMGWLTAIARRLAEDPDCRPGLRVFANTCALEKNGRIYLVDPGTGGAPGAPDLSVRATPVVRRVLALARAGAWLAELRQHVLAASPHATPAKADQLLAELCEHQLLLPALLPALTGDPLASLTGQLAAMPAAAATAARLRAIAAESARLDAAGPAARVTALAALRSQMHELASSLGSAPPAERAETVQVDSALPLSAAGVHRQIADEVRGAVDTLFRLHPEPGAGRLAGYRAAFHRRYGDGRRVPLLELLDPRFGLGPPGGSAEHGYLARPDAGPARAGQAEILRQLLATSVRDGCGEITLSPALLEQLATWTPDPKRLPPSVELSVFVAARSAAAVDRGDYRLVIGPNLGAASAGRGLGRFADLLGAAAHGLLQEAAAAEGAGPGLAAELVCRPARPRAANVAVRPLVRSYEVPVGVAPSLPPGAVAHVDELSVLLRDGRFRVWWEPAGRELSITVGHMLNPAAYPPLGRHLVELASDGVTALAPFDWGPLAAMPFLPRVCAGRVVLCPAQWRLGQPAGQGPAWPGSPAQFDALLADWRARWQLPRHVYLTQADNRLLLDLDDAGHREQLRGALGRGGRRAAVLQEGLPSPDHAWLPGPRGRHIVELVVPMVRDQQAAGPGRRRAAPGHGSPGPGQGAGAPARVMPRWPDSDRLRPPGSDWLYVRLAGPRGTEDALLAGSLGTLADRLVEQGDADGWLFVRYRDPEPQLRLRAHGTAAALTGRVLPALALWAARAIADGARTQLCLETYERELERYGGPVTTGLCERIACVDSRTARRLLACAAAMPGQRYGRMLEPAATAQTGSRGWPADPGDRLELALLSAAGLLASLLPDSGEQARFCNAAAGNATRSGAVFRARQPRLRMLIAALEDRPALADLADGQSSGPPWPRIAAVLADRRTALAPLVAELRERCGDATGLLPFGQLVPSLMHLHANRLGLDRADEQLMFGLLGRTLRSVRAHPVTPPAPVRYSGADVPPGRRRD